MTGTVQIARHNAIATLTLNNPGKMNGVSLAMWHQLRQYCEDLSADTSIRCVVVRGAEGHFGAGGDIAEFPTVRGNVEQLYAYHVEAVAPALQALADCIHPTVALIEGVCMGGGLEIATQCDLRIAGDQSRFGAPINRLGFPMAPHELACVLQKISGNVMAEMLLEGRIYTSTEALRCGLLTRMVAASQVECEAYATAERIAAGAPLAARANKKMLRRLQTSTAPLSSEEVHAAMSEWANSQDHREGVTAFLEKRKPVFVGQ